MKTRRRIYRPTSGQREGRALFCARRSPAGGTKGRSAPDSAGFREWQRIRPEFDSPLWRMAEKGSPARLPAGRPAGMDEAAADGSGAPADEGRTGRGQRRGNGKEPRK